MMLRELENKILQYAGTTPLSALIHDTFRVSDLPHDPILYSDLINAFAGYYMRVVDAKMYAQEQREQDGQSSD